MWFDEEQQVFGKIYKLLLLENGYTIKEKEENEEEAEEDPRD